MVKAHNPPKYKNEAEPREGEPVNVNAPYVEQSLDRLTSTMGIWADPPPDTYEYQWQRDGVDVGTGAASYVVTEADIGCTLVCVVTALNSLGSASSASNGVLVTMLVKPVMLAPDDAWSLFYNGHKIAKNGDPPERWISMGRLGDGTPVLQQLMTPEVEQAIKTGQFYLVE